MQGLISSRPVVFTGQRVIKLLVFGCGVSIVVVLIFTPASNGLFPLYVVISLLFDPMSGLDAADPEQVRPLVRRYLVPALTTSLDQ